MLYATIYLIYMQGGSAPRLESPNLSVVKYCGHELFAHEAELCIVAGWVGARERIRHVWTILPKQAAAAAIRRVKENLNSHTNLSPVTFS